jgi:hypothetical protein
MVEKAPQKNPGDVMAKVFERREQNNSKRWWWPSGVATSLADAAVLAFRGCWHRNMTWPIAIEGYSYQVCLSCGIKRLFDEKVFSAYGPFHYDLDELIAREALRRAQQVSIAEKPSKVLEMGSCSRIKQIGLLPEHRPQAIRAEFD